MEYPVVKYGQDQLQARARRQRAIRLAAAGLAALIAIVYFLIGFQLISVIDTPSDQIFGIFAGAGYALGVALLLRVKRRIVWILGALLQVFVIFTYFNLASERSPAYEVWGIALRVAQVLLLILLAFLAARPRLDPALRPG